MACSNDHYQEPNPFSALVGVYEGSYTAPQGETGLTLTVFMESDDCKAKFEFYNLPGMSNAKNGSYYMYVSYDESEGDYYFTGTEWIVKPEYYDYVFLVGELNNGILEGSVNFLYTFKVVKVGTSYRQQGIDINPPYNIMSEKSVYLSPSLQKNNVGAGDFGSEYMRMNEIADVVQRELEEQGVIVYRSDNDWADLSEGECLNKIATDSNTKNSTIHVALHSNAANGSARGIEIWTQNTDDSRFLAQCVMDKITIIAPASNWDRGLKNGQGTYKETGTSINATSILIEYAFHDNSLDAQWIISNIEIIGKLTAQGIIDYLISQ